MKPFHSSACSSYHACQVSRHALKVGGLGLLGLSVPWLLKAEDLQSAFVAGLVFEICH